MEDEDLKDSIAGDPFHKGLAEHGKFEGFRQDSREEAGRGFVQKPMSGEEIEASRSKLARLIRNPQLLLVLTYIGLLCLMGKAYA